MQTMKRTLLVFILLLLVIPSFVEGAARSQTHFLGFDGGHQGIGLLVGKPSGIRYSHWINWRRALFFDAAYDFDGITLIQGSYAYYFYDAKDQWKKKKGFNSFLFYAAPGISTGFRVEGTDQASAFILGLRGAGGLEYVLGRGTWAVRAELSATLNIIGRTTADLQGFLGLTYYWGQKSKKSSDDEFEDFD